MINCYIFFYHVCYSFSDGVLTKWTKSKFTERYVFLFDGLIVLCKQNSRRPVTGVQPEFRLKEKYQIRKIEVIDREDSDGRLLDIQFLKLLFKI